MLCLPFKILLALIVLGIEPSFGPFEPLFDTAGDRPDIFGSTIVLGLMLLLPLALIIDLTPVA